MRLQLRPLGAPFLCEFAVGGFAHLEKREEALQHKIPRKKNLNHPFTGTTLHTPLASKSTPERLFSSSQSFPPLTDFSSSQFFPPLTEEF